jgi:cytochrome b involved in lipid metabolism
MDQVSQHNTFSDGWVIINGCVYNITPILDDHNPGILNVLGKDATETFNIFHGNSSRIKHKLKKYLIGKIEDSSNRSKFIKCLKLFKLC